MNTGIDYGMGIANVDHDTGIRYGVIHQQEIMQAWADSSKGDYGSEHCPECGNKIVAEHDNGQLFCANCQLTLDSDDCYPEIPLAWTYDGDGYIMQQDGGDCDVFIVKSPYYTLCSFCSPCAPGAGYIMDQNPDGVRAYCPGPDWFDGPPPIAIYSVEGD